MKSYKGIKKVVGMSKEVANGTYVGVLANLDRELIGAVHCGYPGSSWSMMGDGWYQVGYLTRAVTMRALRDAVDEAWYKYECDCG